MLLILMYSLVFIVVIYWDIAGKVKWEVPVTAVGYAGSVWLALKFVRRRAGSDGDIKGGIVEMTYDSFNPLKHRSGNQTESASHLS